MPTIVRREGVSGGEAYGTEACNAARVGAGGLDGDDVEGSKFGGRCVPLTKRQRHSDCHQYASSARFPESLVSWDAPNCVPIIALWISNGIITRFLRSCPNPTLLLGSAAAPELRYGLNLAFDFLNNGDSYGGAGRLGHIILGVVGLVLLALDF